MTTSKLKPGAEVLINSRAKEYAEHNIRYNDEVWTHPVQVGNFKEGVSWALANLPKLLEATDFMDENKNFGEDEEPFKPVAIIEVKEW